MNFKIFRNRDGDPFGLHIFDIKISAIHDNIFLEMASLFRTRGSCEKSGFLKGFLIYRCHKVTTTGSFQKFPENEISRAIFIIPNPRIYVANPIIMQILNLSLSIFIRSCTAFRINLFELILLVMFL